MGSIISTSKCVSSYRFKMMLYLLPLVPLAWGGTLPGSPDLLLGPGGHYEHPIDPDYYSQNEVYKIKDKDDCHPVERTVYKDECLPYVEKTCYTQQVEQCKDDFQCIDLEHQYCWDEEKIVKDRTCVYGIDFECGKHKDKDGKGAVKCEKVPKKKCYDTPRKVREETCRPQYSRFCEKFTNEFPVPEQKQNCHTEPMKRCELEVRSRPKKAKKYVYHKDCKPVSRKVCDTCEKKTLSPVCDKIHKQVCKHKPEEKCHEEKKEYCFKTEKIIIDKVCVGEKKEVYDETFSYV